MSRPFEKNSSQGDLEKTFGAFGRIVMPSEAKSPILTKPVRNSLQQWMLEMNAAKELEAVGLSPRRRAMLFGPPGTGKTTLAHHVAARLGKPMLVVMCHEIASMYVGQTGDNIAKLFRAARADRYEIALFFDEFDALAVDRSKIAGDRANVVIALLQEFDRFQGMLFAASNIKSRIDAAIWRRFEMQIEIGLPGEEERFALVKQYLSPFAVHENSVAAIADAMEDASPALIQQACEFIKRSMVLAPRTGLSTELDAIMERFSDNSAPAEDQPLPLLWDRPGIVLPALAEVPWPPVLNTGG